MKARVSNTIQLAKTDRPAEIMPESLGSEYQRKIPEVTDASPGVSGNKWALTGKITSARSYRRAKTSCANEIARPIKANSFSLEW